jgi:hypothetical protein
MTAFAAVLTVDRLREAAGDDEAADAVDALDGGQGVPG